VGNVFGDDADGDGILRGIRDGVGVVCGGRKGDGWEVYRIGFRVGSFQCIHTLWIRL
jgi:hypothetical protein